MGRQAIQTEFWWGNLLERIHVQASGGGSDVKTR